MAAVLRSRGGPTPMDPGHPPAAGPGAPADPGRRWPSWPAAPPFRAGPPGPPGRPPRSARPSSTPARLPDFRADTAALRAADWRVAPTAGRAARPPGRDHRPGRAEDGHQRAQLRRQGATWPTSRTRPRRPGPTCSPASARCASGRRHARLDGAATARQALRAEAVRRAGRADGAPARLAPGREARARRRRADVGVAVRPRPVRLPQRARARGEGPRPVLLPAQAAVDGGSGAVGRRARARRSARSACRTGR